MTAKPVGLLRDLVRWVPEGAEILDPFAGGGSTLAAAQLEGRRAVGIEMLEHNVAATRDLLLEAELYPQTEKFARKGKD
jgi:site-specific DNA-methyltransferase (adenine-specific)